MTVKMRRQQALWILGVILSLVARPVKSICPDLCKCDDVNLIVTCIKAGLDTMPNTLNPGLKTIVYNYNDFPTIHFSLTFLPALEKVDMSHNKIVDISPKAFERQNHLGELRLDNNKIIQVNNNTFYGLRKLKVLTLRGNLIESLPKNLFKHAPSLEELDFSTNRISSIHPEAFEGLTSLRILRLESNELASIPMESLQILGNLAELNLAGNPLRIVPDRAFSYFRNLASLDLSSARLRVIEDSAFWGLGTLRQLKLADNNLSTVPSEIFKNTPNLEVLDIGRNPFQVLPRGTFRFLNKLKKLDISGCGRLELIESQAFINCVDLEHVTISLNRKLSQIANDAFDAMPQLRFLSLADNGFRSLPESLVEWSSLRSLDLSGNPWHCDCKLNFLGRAVRSIREKIKSNDPGGADTILVKEDKCQSPVEHSNELLSTSVDRECSMIESNNVLVDVDEKNFDMNRVMVRHEPSKANDVLMNDSSKSGVLIDSHAGGILSSVIISVVVALAVLIILGLLVAMVYRARHRIQDYIKSWRQPNRHAPRHAGKVVQYPYQDPFFRQPSFSCDDEHYYYVATMQNRMTAGKHIPVTEL